jgi:hypothetical protein
MIMGKRNRSDEPITLGLGKEMEDMEDMNCTISRDVSQQSVQSSKMRKFAVIDDDRLLVREYLKPKKDPNRFPFVIYRAKIFIGRSKSETIELPADFIINKLKGSTCFYLLRCYYYNLKSDELTFDALVEGVHWFKTPYIENIENSQLSSALAHRFTRPYLQPSVVPDTAVISGSMDSSIASDHKTPGDMTPPPPTDNSLSTIRIARFDEDSMEGSRDETSTNKKAIIESLSLMYESVTSLTAAVNDLTKSIERRLQTIDDMLSKEFDHAV